MVFFGLAGCGQTVLQTVHAPSPAEPRGAAGKIVVLPFADYSSGDYSSAFMRHLTITEAVTDELVVRGFQLPVEEDVFKYLVDEGIITPVSYSEERPSAELRNVEEELAGGWSDVMKDELRKVIATEKERDRGARAAEESPLSSPGTHGLDRKSVADLGRQFGAAYVVRGRIIEYDVQQEHTFDPVKIGILPFFFNTTNRLAFGIAKSDRYDTLDSLLVGGTLGAIIGNNASSPFEPADVVTTTTTSGHPLSPTIATTAKVVGGTEDYASLNSMVWGAAGAGAAYLAQQGGDVPQAVVQLRLWVQDVASGEVVWTNRAEVKVSPESVFADKSQRALFATAVQKSVAALVNDMAAKL